ncbi:hypothetical protein Q763_07950 [Flavobacterium beibuense F44-8]|uniref:Uncharacterized protein n=1 Tax=Flavobacterium beibuense F44-8 TaxID=1406840 RepID=A0A0A2LQQ7_9FLAO|nr:hypothetical protein [Flavobacterium beibuense]KGO81568.1 hypothetical protein Q763_07950 [Flavobacterium beibuense F44-8]
MNDLINEEEFIKPEKDNPWKWFLLFYGIVIGYLLCKFLFKAILKENSTYVYPLFAITDFALPFVMIFTKKKNIYLPYKNIIVAVTGVYVIYLLVQLIQIYLSITNPLIPKDLYYYMAKNCVINQSILLGITLIIITPIIIFKRRKNST